MYCIFILPTTHLSTPHLNTPLGKPVWVAYTLRDDRTACLRSGQPLQVALDALADVHQHVQAVLINCCAPQVCCDTVC